MASEASFRRLSLTDQETLTPNDHGPIIGNDKPLPRHTVKKAAGELNESISTKTAEIANLRLLINNGVNVVSDENKLFAEKIDKYFSGAPDSDLVRFLRARKFDSEKAYELMKGYVRYRINHPDVVNDICENNVRRWVEKGQPGVLPSRDAQGRVIMFFRLHDWNPDEYSFTQVMQSFVFVLENLLQSEETQINGVCLIEDFSGYTMAHVASTNIREYKQMIDMLQGSFPCRFKGVHCIRQPWFFAKVFNLIKPFLRAKLFERIYVYGEDLDTLFNDFPKAFLPEDLGGTAPPYDGRAVAEMLFGSSKIKQMNEKTQLP